MTDSDDEKILTILRDQVDLFDIVSKFKSSDEAKQVIVRNIKVYEKTHGHSHKHPKTIFLDPKDTFERSLREVTGEKFFKENYSELVNFLH